MRSSKQFLLRQFFYFVVALIICAIAYIVTQLIAIGGWLGLCLQAIVCICVTTLLLFVIFFRTKEFTEATKFVIRVVQKAK